MNTLDRYLYRTVLIYAGLTMAVLLTLGRLFLFITQQGDIGVGNYGAGDAFMFTLLNIPQQAFELMPIAARVRGRDGRTLDETWDGSPTGYLGTVVSGFPNLFMILGPNVGKSRLLSRLTRATPEVAPYPFTTREPHAGMMEWEDVRVQLIDLPPITADFMEGYVSTMVRTADAALLLVDLGDDDGPFAAEAALERLAHTKTVLTGQRPAAIEDPAACDRFVLREVRGIDPAVPTPN